MQYPPSPGGPGYPAPPPSYGQGSYPPPPPDPGFGYPGGPQPPWLAPPPPAPDMYGQLPPSAPTGSRRRRVAVSAAVFVIIAGLLATAISAFLVLRGSADTVGHMVPADTSVYATYYLDPSGGQKLALSHLIDKFPALADATKRDQALNDALDQSLRALGMDHNDVRPWLGAQAGFSLGGDLSLSPATGKEPSIAVYIATKSDSQTSDALGKVRRSKVGGTLGYSDANHDGVSETAVSVSPLAGVAAGPGFAYAVVDHTLVVASSITYLDLIIDTDHGKKPALQSTADWTAVQRNLPSDRLFLLYLDFPGLLKSVQGGVGAAPAPALSLDKLKAFRGFGLAASVVNNGFAIDAVADYDPGRLDDATRKVMGIPAHRNSTAADSPASALGYLGLTGTQYLLRSFADTLAQTSPQASQFIAGIGLSTALGHFTGDSGLEFELRDGKTPAAAWIVATDNEQSTRAFLDKAIPALIGSGSRIAGISAPGSSGISPGVGTSAPPKVSHENYQGVDLSEMTGAGTTGAAWTVTKGVAIVGSDAAEVKAVIDAAGGGANLASAPAYTGAMGDGVSNNGSLYIDVHGTVDAIEKNLPPNQKASFDRDVLPNLRPIQAIVITETNASDHTSSRLLVEIP